MACAVYKMKREEKKPRKVSLVGVYCELKVVLMRINDCILNQMSYWLRRVTHYGRMKHIERGRDWRFYEQYSIGEILRMKLDGTEEAKYWIWHHRR